MLYSSPLLISFQNSDSRISFKDAHLSLLLSIIMEPSSMMLLRLLSTMMELNRLKHILLKLSLLMLRLFHLCL